MCSNECAGEISVGERNRQLGQFESLDGGSEIVRQDCGRSEFAEAILRAHFPRAGSAHENIARVGDRLPRGVRQGFVACCEPEKCMRVEKKALHRLLSFSPSPSHARSSSSGSCSKNSCPTFASPLYKPKRRCGTGFSGTSFTTGFFPRAMTISSPASARSMRLDKFVFAAWMVMTDML